MKIVFYSHTPDRGNGAAESLYTTVEALQKNHDCTVIVFREGELCEDLKKGGVNVIVLPFFWLGNFNNKFNLFEVKKTYKKVKKWIKNYRKTQNHIAEHCKVIKEINPDIIYTNTSVIGIGLLVSRKLNIPHLWHLREFQSLDYKINPDFGWLYFSYLLKQSKLIVTNSAALKSFYSNYVSHKKIKVIYNGIEFGQPKLRVQVNNKRFTFLMVGIIKEYKGHLIALKALNELVKKGLNLNLKIVGTGDFEETIKKFVLENKLTDHVEFCGFQKTVDSFYASSDCYLMCSKHEAFGRVTIEAMSYKLPVIGYGNKYCGTQEIIRDGQDGLIYNGDYLDLSRKMQWVVENKDEALKMGKVGREHAEKLFSTTLYAEKIESVLIELNSR